jgi:hypothetical protein
LIDCEALGRLLIEHAVKEILGLGRKLAQELVFLEVEWLIADALSAD